MTTLGIIQARMDSSRLPGKVLLQLGGRSVLERCVRSAQLSGVLDQVIVATTVEETDDVIVEECARIGVPCHRGPVDDVLARFLGVLDDYESDIVLRFTADNPLIDPAIISRAHRVFVAAGADYLTTSIAHTLPRGLDVEMVRTPVLRAIDALATEHHRVHVTSYIYTHANDFDVIGLTLQPDLSHLRLTVDTEDDWRVVSAIVDHFGDEPVALHELVAWLESRPELIELNAHVLQKALVQA
ncbi:cytidylyltransferase domain-containing protein [Paractinoplanes durhamensis]|uniref:Flagellin modification protein FlmC n=1 Tax=Paractinoplanes durhamensis TaxID=113563 RepID=A0ABQ3Z1L9_9ACTN|nr:glycosyltransferase family protein [Actinoplanes durhamensis]GIE03708.1 flagellin modification protein FlmC [Actinoplanes durhamensis]